MVTPSNANLSDLYSHLSPLMLHELAEMTGMPQEEAAKLANPRVR
jgi:hypothetical protein